MTKTNKTNTNTAKKENRFEITALALSDTPESGVLITEVMNELATAGNTVDENLKNITMKQLKAVYMGKGQASGCATVFKAIFTSVDYRVTRFAPLIKSFVGRCGLKFSTGGMVPKALQLPEGVPSEPSEEGWEAYKAWIEENVKFNPKSEETAEEAKARIDKETEDKAKQWKGNAGRNQAILALLKLQKRIAPLNKKQASIIRLIACNYDTIEATLTEMGAGKGKKLNRKIPEGIPFKE